jgi:acetyl esterase/lipase
MNIIRPAGCNEDDKLPVAFWIHGGGFSEGGGVDQRYNLSFTVENSVKIGKVRYDHLQELNSVLRPWQAYHRRQHQLPTKRMGLPKWK